MSPSPAGLETPPETRLQKVSSRHVVALDGLRGLAVLFVILYHVNSTAWGTTFLDRIVRAPLKIGWAGVDLFFVLSGFLITGILLDTRQSPHYFRSFYARRALRIFPLYYLVLTASLLITRFTPALNYVLPIPHDRIFYFVYLNKWWPLLRDTWHANIIGHFWSLAVEEQFYLLWSLCVFLVSPRLLKPVTAVGILGALAIRLVLYAHSGVTRELVENTFARMDSLLAGAFLASAVRSPEFLKRIQKYVYLLGITSALLALAIFYGSKNEGLMDTLGLTLLALAFGALLLKTFVTDGSWNSPLQRFLSNRQLTTVGTYSYGMYVYHVPILYFSHAALTRFFPLDNNLWNTGILMIVVLAITFGVAKVSFDMFESRFLRLKKYFCA